MILQDRIDLPDELHADGQGALRDGAAELITLTVSILYSLWKNVGESGKLP